jgi:hypothetical protein
VFTRQQVFDKIKHQREKYNWQFIFLGANQDAIATGTSIGIDPRFALTYNYTANSTSKAYGTMSTVVSATRSLGADKATGFTTDDRDDILNTI